MAAGIDLKVSEMVIILFTTLGPVKLILPFNSLTEHIEYKNKIRVALFCSIISTVIIMVVLLFGPNIIEKWELSRQAIAITGGIILFLQGLGMAIKNPAHIDEQKMFLGKENFINDTPLQLAHKLIIPSIITPAGIMVILSVRSLHNAEMNTLLFLTLKIIIIILILNFIVMLITPFICKIIKPIYFRILGWIFSIFIMILGVHIIMQTLLKIKLNG